MFWKSKIFNAKIDAKAKIYFSPLDNKMTFFPSNLSMFNLLLVFFKLFFINSGSAPIFSWTNTISSSTSELKN